MCRALAQDVSYRSWKEVSKSILGLLWKANDLDGYIFAIFLNSRLFLKSQLKSIGLDKFVCIVCNKVSSVHLWRQIFIPVQCNPAYEMQASSVALNCLDVTIAR